METLREELSRKLAERAGIEHRKVKVHDKQVGGEFEGFDWEREMYIFPDGSMSKELDFTTNLSLCFKWLVPEGNVTVLIREVHTDGTIFTQATINKDGKDFYGEAVKGQMKDRAALALCLAIIKLIE